MNGSHVPNLSNTPRRQNGSSNNNHANHRIGTKTKPRGLPSSRNSGNTISTNSKMLIRVLFAFILCHFVWMVYCAIVMAGFDDSASGGGSQSSRRFASKNSNTKTKFVRSNEQDQELKFPKKEWEFNLETTRNIQSHLLQKTQRTTPVLTAYLEPPQFDIESKRPPPKPQPIRKGDPSHLQAHQYPQVSTCSTLPHLYPVNNPLELNDVYKNVNNRQSNYDIRFEYAKYCPVDADPFLPWIHDVFPSFDGKFVDFVAQNRRRCNTNLDQFSMDLKSLEPQVALMQPVPIKRVNTEEEEQLVKEMWNGDGDDDKVSLTEEDKEIASSVVIDPKANVNRYRLATYEDADEDAMETRYICRVHTLDFSPSENGIEKVILGETLSVYPYNPEYASHRKSQNDPMLKEGGKGGNNNFWLSVNHFRCPIPTHLHSLIQSGESVVDGDVPSVFLDLIPIRTRTREKGEEYMMKDLAGPNRPKFFDPEKEWGKKHILPRVETSGRLANIPICIPPQPTGDHANPARVAITNAASDIHTPAKQATTEKEKHSLSTPTAQKPHTLIGCLWASASFSTRGNAFTDTSTQDRLLEWLTYNLHVANFDHIYVYDNSGAHTNATNLEPIINLFPSTQVTRIPWSHRVCNNNIPAHANTGERSSQYAAEASCRIRYGPHTEWLASFDTDEYLIPMGTHDDLPDWLNSVQPPTNVLSFRSTKAWTVHQHMEPYWDEFGIFTDAKGPRCGSQEEKRCMDKLPSSTYLDTYNCESDPLPKPDWAQRAKKQIYRPAYVLNHYVHYSTVTKGLVKSYKEHKELNERYGTHYSEPESTERFVYEKKEATMIHTKTTKAGETDFWTTKCKLGYKSRHGYDVCRVGFPWPENYKEMQKEDNLVNDLGYAYNCYPNERVNKEFSPNLKEALKMVLDRKKLVLVEERMRT